MAQKVVQYGFTGFLIVVWDVLVLKKNTAFSNKSQDI